MVGYGGSSAGSYLADPTSPIPSHCASVVLTSTLRVNKLLTRVLSKAHTSTTLISFALDHNVLILNGSSIYTKITEGNLSVFVYRLFHEDFSQFSYICVYYAVTWPGSWLRHALSSKLNSREILWKRSLIKVS